MQPNALIEGWISRWARPSKSALEAVAILKPAVIVTGGSKGIGYAIAQRFAAEGHHVAIIARGRPQLELAAQSIAKSTGSEVMSIALDVTSPAAAAQLEADLKSRGHYVDVLVNNAGIGLAGPFVDCDSDRLEQLLSLNVMALSRLTRHFLPPMIERARGGIVNVASLGAYSPGPFQAAYYASKAYVLSLTEAIAAEAAGSGVRVCVVAPGPVETRFHSDMGADHALYRYIIPSLTPDAVARSAYSAFLRGQRVVVPGIVAKLLMLGSRFAPHPLSSLFMAPLLRPPAIKRTS